MHYLSYRLRSRQHMTSGDRRGTLSTSRDCQLSHTLRFEPRFRALYCSGLSYPPSLHLPAHSPHDILQLTRMNPGFFSHSPFSAHP